MHAPERGQHLRDHLVGAEAARVDDHVRPAIVRLALAIESLDLVEWTAVEHRPSSAASRAFVQRRNVTREPHDGAELAQHLHATLATRQASARGDDLTRLQ